MEFEALDRGVNNKGNKMMHLKLNFHKTQASEGIFTSHDGREKDHMASSSEERNNLYIPLFTELNPSWMAYCTENILPITRPWNLLSCNILCTLETLRRRNNRMMNTKFRSHSKKQLANDDYLIQEYLSRLKQWILNLFVLQKFEA